VLKLKSVKAENLGLHDNQKCRVRPAYSARPTDFTSPPASKNVKNVDFPSGDDAIDLPN
jgi:hypothetical protein